MQKFSDPYWLFIIRQLTFRLSIALNRENKFLKFDKDKKSWSASTYILISFKYSHIFSRRSSKFHLWWADSGIVWGIL